MNVTLRRAVPEDAGAIFDLIASNVETGHLLPRTEEEIRTRIAHFVVAAIEADVVGCAELARLSPSIAEVRSLVVRESARGRRIGPQLIAHLAAGASVAGYATLCAFTHDPSHFVRLGFTIVPHIWVPEKIAHDCTGCLHFRRCGQYAVRLELRRGASLPERTAARVYGRGVAPRRPNIERLQLTPVEAGTTDAAEEAEAVVA